MEVAMRLAYALALSAFLATPALSQTPCPNYSGSSQALDQAVQNRTEARRAQDAAKFENWQAKRDAASGDFQGAYQSQQNAMQDADAAHQANREAWHNQHEAARDLINGCE